MSISSLATRRIIKSQRTALSILIASGIVNYLDRATLSVANPLIREDLGLNVAQMGILLSAFLWAYAFSQLPAGALVDRVGPRWLLGIGLMVWSGAQIVAGTVSNIGQFAIARVFLGMGESPQFTSGVRVVRDWFNVRERAFGIGLVNTSPFIGQAIAPPLLTAMMLGFGWRWMFIVMGGAGMAVAVVWVALFREPRKLALEPEERAYLTEGDPPQVTAPITFAQWRHLFAFRSTWGLIGGCFGLGYCTWLYGTWLPGYLEIERHMSIRATGYVASIPFALAVLGAAGGGLLADRLVRRGVSPVNSRKVPLVFGMIGVAVFTIGAAEVSSNTMAVTCVTLAMVSGAVCSGLYWALASAIAPSNCTASAGSLANFGSYIGGAITPAVTGVIVQTTGSFKAALLLGGGIALVSALSYLLLVKNESMDFSGLNAKVATRAAAE
ncbi:MFS transporter [Acidisphaera sp. S103]|uniref:MFS transporter n=1 Tax=Acidisphaera sp. S103 TaxID=1747223 RepID=UPI001C207D4D|nr:MFS transporter [Acidisphaera sp. S103]